MDVLELAGAPASTDSAESHPAPDRKIAEDFVRMLTGSPDTIMCWRLLPDSRDEIARVAAFEQDERLRREEPNFGVRHNFDGSLADVWPEIVAHQGQGWGAFVVINEGGHNKRSIVNGGRVRALFIDMDERKLSEARWHVEPDFVAKRDETHWHAYWLVDGLPVESFEAAQRRLITYYGSDPSVRDLPRVLRVPGTLHLKDPTHSQLVTLLPNRDVWETRYSFADVMADLPELPTGARPGAPSAATGATVSAEHLRMLLGYLDPNAPRDVWRDFVAAIRATPIDNDDDESERRQIALQFSRGELARDEKSTGTPPPRYTDDEAVNRVFDTMPPKNGGVTFGTIVHAAQAAGYGGAPSRRSGVDAFADYFDGRKGASIARAPLPRFLMTEDDIFAWPDPEELVGGFIMCGENVCLYGQPKVGKTFIALDLALSIAANLPVFGHLPVRKTGAVVYLSGEGHAGMKRRVKAWRQERGISKNQRLPFFYRAEVPNTAAGVDECRKYINGIKDQLGTSPLLVVIDTMARSMSGLNENDAGDVGLYLALTERLRSGLDCPVLTLAHSGKDETKGIRGSNASTAGFDAIWVAEMNMANKTVKIESKWLKDSEELGPFCFRLKHLNVDGMSNGKGAVLEYVPIDEFKKASDEQDVFSRSNVYRVLSELGAVDRASGVTTTVLRESLVPRFENQSDDDRGLMLRRASQTLSHRISHRCKWSLSLAAYAFKGQGPGGTATLWYVPPKKDGNTRP